MNELKDKLTKMMNDLIKKHKMTYQGEEVQGDVYKIRENGNQIEVVWNDEYIGYLLAGYVAETAYDEMEEEFKKLGLEMVDSDGNMAVMERI